MSLSTYFLEYGRHVGQLRRRRRAYAPTSNTASHENHVKINSWVSFVQFLNSPFLPMRRKGEFRNWTRVFFAFLYEYGARLFLF